MLKFCHTAAYFKPKIDPDDIILVDSYGTNLQHSIAAENQYVLLNFVCSCITCGLSTFLVLFIRIVLRKPLIRQPELPLRVRCTKYHVAESKQSDNDHGSVIEFNIGNDVQNKRLNELTEVMSQPQKQMILEALTKNPDLLDDQIQSISILQNRHFQFEFIVDFLKNKYKQIECPITMEPLTAQNVLILNCGHYYDFTGLEDYEVF